MKNNDPAKALYLQVEEALEERIRAGEWKAGDRIPTERELLEEFGVSIITVRRAVTELCKKGLVEKQQGRGTFVRNSRFVRDSSFLMSFTESCRIQGMKPGARLLKAQLAELDEKTAAALGLLPGGPGQETGPVHGVFLSRLRTADGFPVAIEDSWFGPNYAALLQEDLNDASLYAYLKEHMGVTVARSDKEIRLCEARPEEARLLQIPLDTPLIMIRSTAYTQTGEPLYVGTQIMNGKIFTLRIRQGI